MATVPPIVKFTNIAGEADVTNNAVGSTNPLDAVNNDLQFAATTTSLVPLPQYAQYAFFTAGLAFTSANNKLITDLVNPESLANPTTTIIGDMLTVLGDYGMMQSAAIEMIPGGYVPAYISQKVSVGITALGVGVDLAAPYVNNISAATNSLWNQATSFFSSSQTTNLSATPQAFQGGYNIFQNDMKAFMGDASTLNSSNAPLTQPLKNALINDVNNLNNGSSAFFSGTGFSPTTLNLSINPDNSLDISKGSTLIDSSNLQFGNNGSFNINTNNSSQQLLQTQDVQFGNDGSVVQTQQGYSTNTILQYAQSTTTSPTGQTSYNTKTYDPTSGALTQDFVINPTGASSLTPFAVLTQYTNGNAVMVDKYNAAGAVTQDNVLNFDVTKFGDAAASALATQVIGQFLFKNNLPASAVAQAFSTVVFNNSTMNAANAAAYVGLTAQQKFMANFGLEIANIAASIGGSVAGAKLFQALGLPTQVGSVVGGVVSQQVVAAAIAQAGSTSATLTLGGLVTGLQNAGGAAIGSYVGVRLAKLTLGSLNEDASFGGAVGSAIGVAYGEEIGAFLGSSTVIGTLVGAAVGSYLGSLFGSLFGGGSSGDPTADSSIAYNGTQWYLYVSKTDNRGNVSIAQQLAQATIGELNGIASAIGGHIVVNQPGFGVGYFASRGYYTNFQINGQNNFTYSNSTQTTVDNAVIAAVHREVASGGIQGGDPFMEYAYAHSTATTVSGLISDLNAAHDYGQYLENPLAFDANLAMSGSQAQLNAWQQEMSQAQALGLGTVPNTADLNNGILTESGAYVASHLEILNDFYTSKLINSITLTDNTLTIGANQLSQYNNLLSTISQNNRNSITISDTNANISANIVTINAYITGNLIAAVNTTDSTSSFINSTTLTLAANSVQTITGRGNTLNLSTGDSLTLNTIGTGGNVVNGANGDTVYFYGNVSQTAGAVIDRVNMNNGVLELGKNACVNLYGYGNTIIENDNVTLSVFGNNNGIQGADGQTIYNDFSGGYNITVGNNSTINITGNGFTGNNGGVDNLTLFGGHVNVLPTLSNIAGADININGSNNVITLYSKDNVIVTGGNNTIDSNGLGNSVTVSGNGSNGGNGGVDTINMFNGAVNVVASASTIVNGYGNTITEATGDTVTFNSSGGNGGSNLYISVGATLNFSGNAALLSNGIIDKINASGDIVNAANGSCYNLFGSNNTTNNGNNVTLTEFGNNDGINGGTGNTVYTDFGGGYNIAEGTGSKVIVAGNGQTGTTGGVDNLYLSSGTVNFVASSSSIVGADASVTGSNNTINMIASDTLSLNGNANIINAVSGDAIILAANSQITINGSGLTITAATGDNITLNGTTGSNHIIGSGAYTLTLNGASKGTGNNYGRFGFAGNKEVVQNYINHNASGNPALQEIQAAINASGDATILEGGKWGKEVVTWNMGNIDNNSVFQHDIQGAFNAWSKVTGTDFVETASSNKADITFDFSNFDSLSSGVVGYTNYSSNNGIFTSANINLENPNQDSLINTRNGLTYSGTNATFKQVVEHEIGHAIGFADNNDPKSIMNYYLGSQNQTLSSRDIAAASSLYPQTEAAIGFNSHYLNLIQDIGSLGFNQSSSSSLLGSGNPFPNNNVIASSSQIHHI